ncbi:GmrSD restriction endonuclease domain-containing protein [Seohaeicola zhoushanensis]|uniref:GmrSD restriction endonucleases N-terminal domain-containing protein n=1 Tax=Seohaeicola zhoushanensis TaxID=1569283 RepID=A0A8J3MAL4_9RHOB|nr:DUF262 domain-containing protein [Seohaeicola zhoushanensis]GHF58051.1 hypothetical protein GCM10017056_31950 [Seohaeicola zhoushanensis]
MKDAQKPNQFTLNNLLSRLKEGRFVVPDFQREFEWNPWDISDLMRSIFLDYYVGSLLLWKGKDENFKALACEPIYGHPGGGSSEHIVLDGQQRLTALYYACVAPDVPLPDRANRAIYFINVDRFMREEYDDAFGYDWKTKRIDKLTQDPKIQYREHIFPLSVIGAGGWAMPTWVQGYAKYWQDMTAEAKERGDLEEAEQCALHGQNAEKFGQELKDLTEQYQVSYIELDKDLGLDKICDIFTQINSKGIRLDVFDLLNALLKPRDLQLKFMWRKARGRLEFVESSKLNVYILQVMSILKQAYCSPKYLYYLMPGHQKTIRTLDGKIEKEVLVQTTEEFVALWDTAVSALERAIKMLRHPQEFGVTSSKYLPYVSILPAFSALQEHVRTLPADKRLNAQRKVRFWYWAAIFTNRYSGSVESTAARDYQNVKAWIESDANEPPLIQEFKTRFKNLELRRETKYGSSIYNGIFNLLVLNGARDWITGNIPENEMLDDHHIVPASWGDANLQDRSVHSILNRTPLLDGTNRHVIRDKLPNEYLPELIKQNGENRVRAILESHLISPAAFDILMRSNFSASDFEEFINERQRTYVEAIESLLIKERLDLSPDLRDLDARIETVELGLRATIETALHAQEDPFPQHVMDKVQQRLNRAQRKNPAFDKDRYAIIGGMLEFCDLQELKDIVLAKNNWHTFSETFRSKEDLSKRVDQLAEMRNGIRHSRTIDEISKKDGEAALLWFEKVNQSV